MDIESLKAIGAGLATIFIAFFGAFSQWQAQRAKKEAKANLVDASISRQYQEKATTMEKEANYWRLQYETQRKYWHDKAEADQAIISKCQTECSELKATRDFSPVLEHIKRMDAVLTQQGQINSELFRAINGLSRAIDRMNHRHGIFDDDTETKARNHKSNEAP